MNKCLGAVELQGIKTFATLTRLEFPGKITAIVGPNGSGKSNIADSIRWVLGEQSYSQLRAKKTEDMIFSGSQQRSRAGMASATIIFNNQDGWLPIDYSEVSISRRAYRDGQNEYLLNGQKVRLKDISELLSQTGLAERTYTIIGQGLVDVALALKPDERRKLFEEAAGIGLYRSRKEESLRRLENTRKNLDRVLDIMTEIRPRLRTLERQTDRFKEFQQLRSALLEILREWYGFHWHQKQQDLSNIQYAFQDQEKRLIALRKKHLEVESQVEEAQEQLKMNRSSLEMAHNELSEFHHQLEGVTRELAIIEERKHSFNQQRSDLEIDIANIEEEHDALESRELSYKADIDRCLSDYESANEAYTQAEVDLTELTAKHGAIQNKLDDTRQKRISLEKERIQLSAHLEGLINRFESLSSETSKIEDSIQKLYSEKTDIAASVNALEQIFKEEQKHFIETNRLLEENYNKLKERSNEKKAVEQQISINETKQTRLQTQLDVLIQAESALSGYSEGSKTIVEKSRKGRLPGGIEPLSRHIIVVEQYEKALSAALGEFTDLLIVPSGETSVVIEFLEKNENERVALVSMENTPKKDQPNELRSVEGFVGFASEFIQIDQKYRQLAEVLLSDTLIMRDRLSAERIQSELTGQQKVVTLTGLVFQANGVMISGQSGSGKRIGRTRQQSELKQAITQVAQVLRELSEDKKEIQGTIDQLEKYSALLSEDSGKAEQSKAIADQQLRKAKDTLTRITEQIVWHDDRLVEVQEDILKTRKLMDIDNTQVEGIDEKISELITAENKLSNMLGELPVFEAQQKLNHWQTHQIVTQNALETAQQRYQDHCHRFEDARQRLRTYQSRLATLEDNLSIVQEKQIHLKSNESSIQQTIKAVEEEKILPLTSRNEELEQKVSALHKLEDHSHQQVIIGERQFTQFQLELSRREDQLTNLQEKIESDFGLVAFDYDQKITGPTPLPFDNGLIENLPRVSKMSENIEKDIAQLKGQIRRIGPINAEAQQEYYEVKERFDFLTEQTHDLEKASEDLRDVIDELDSLMERDFIKTFKSVDREFGIYFKRLFNGGEAKLIFSDEEDPVEGGIDIEARLPGRRQQGLALLSGGERSLAAVALIFSLLKVSPTPFCVLDEVDAMLDESNVGRFIELLKELSQDTQFVIITHNRNTVQAADVIYGVTMGRDSTSQMISLKLEEVDESYLE